MKYYLVIGYQSIEKWREYGRIQILLNNNLLDDFPADNENQIDISHKHNINLENVNSFADFILENQFDDQIDADMTVLNRDQKKFRIQQSQPKKLRVLEIESQNLQNKNTLLIRIVGGPSNNQNGFVSKKNMISIFPVFLIPAGVFRSTKLVSKFIKANKKFYKRHNAFMQHYPFFANYKLQQKDNELNTELQIETVTEDVDYKLAYTPIQWPGTNYHRSGKNLYNLFGNFIGGNKDIELFLHKKHNTFMISPFEHTPKGIWQINMCFVHLYEKLANLIQKQHK